MKTQIAPTTNGTLLFKKTNRLPQNSQEVFKVLSTMDYSAFKKLQDNREINQLHVDRLIESFRAHHLVCPIIVNEKLEVIDGQHRLEASKETGVPIYFIIVNGYGIDEVSILNVNQKNWTRMDYLKRYYEEGLSPYVELVRFMKDFPDFGIQSALRLVTLTNTGHRNGQIAGKKVQMKDFEEGKLNIPNITQSYIYARKLMDIKPFYSNFNRGTFVSAMLPLFKNKVYNHKEMIHKFGSCPIKMTDQLSVEAYRMAIEEIYNYKRQKENKVSFRYA